MNGPEMVFGIVLVVMIAGVLKVWLQNRGKHPVAIADDAETKRLREEVQSLRDRVQVLERIATDRNHLLEQQIDALRDR